MVFTSPRFLIFLGLVLFVMGLVRSNQLRKRFLLVASCFFYAAWDWRYLGLLVAISAIDYVTAVKICRANRSGARKGWLLLSICSNIGMLAYFKYYIFIVSNLNPILHFAGMTLPVLDVLLPVGISFYTFKTMSYVIDVYRGEIEPCKSWIDYATFVTFFPELIAGPIVRASIFLPQMNREIGPTPFRILVGSSLFVQGLLKKFLVADRISVAVDPIFASPDLFSPLSVWSAVVAYAVQIYCDFSGYSDMAVGTARMIGYDLPENFNTPYLSTNIAEFWKRWHITLSTWLRDYVYIPLGGNRGSKVITYRNLMLTMLLGGLWHGANWNFVLWGGLHGTALVLHRFWRSRPDSKFEIPAWFGWVLTMLFVLITWIPFRSASFHHTVLLYHKMFAFGSAPGAHWISTWLLRLGPVVLIGHAAAFLMRTTKSMRANRAISTFREKLGFAVEFNPISGPILYPVRATIVGSYAIFLLLFVIFFFAPFNTSPFIYFQF